jgi:HK97 family phage prohead protease
MKEYEKRFFEKRSFQPTVGNDNRLSGQAAPFNSPTLIAGAFREQIDPRAFNKTLADGDQVLLDNHDRSHPLARRSAGTLQLSTNRNGLQWSAQVSKTSYGNDAITNVRDGNYAGCSFSFEVTRNGETWDENTEDGIPLRTLTDIKCPEISIVTFPAYSDTSVANRMVELAFESRDAYFSRGELHSGNLNDDSDDDNKPYGDVHFADPKNGKYPLDSKQHIQSAWAFINMPSHAATYPLNGVTLSEVKNAIIKAAKSAGINIADGGGAVSGRWVEDDPNRPTRELDQYEEDALRHIHAENLRHHARDLKRHMGAEDVPSSSERDKMASRHGLAVARGSLSRYDDELRSRATLDRIMSGRGY